MAVHSHRCLVLLLVWKALTLSYVSIVQTFCGLSIFAWDCLLSAYSSLPTYVFRFYIHLSHQISHFLMVGYDGKMSHTRDVGKKVVRYLLR